MAANEITFKVKVTKDGSLKVVAKDADAAAKGTEKLGKATDDTAKARNRYSRGEKGVAQAGMNSTKSFSKMRDVMGGGSSGLVGAYATLAANVFALTAAFGILQRAAAAQQLAEGLEFTGTVAGRNLPFVADKLREITGAAVSTQEAMSAVALATSSGFSSKQISDLGEVAKGASLALGRDMTDSLNRLIRGSAKLEPELLDELGIMVRLDQAAEDYARELGTTAGALTQFQKRQAFVNAVISEGQKSFSGIAEEIDPNAYDQLAASLSDLLKDFINLLNKGLIPVVKLFSNSPAALVGGALLFASTIRGALLPGLTQGAQKMANFASESKAAAQASFANVSTTGALPKVYTELATKIQNGTATTEDFNKAQSSLSNSMAKHNRDLKNNSALQDTNTKKGAAKAAKIAEVTAAQNKLNNITILGAQADTAAARASAVNSAAQLSFAGTIKGVRASMAAYRLEITATSLANGGASASFVGLRVAMLGAATGAKALGVALLTAMPYLALLPVLFGLGKAAYDKFFGDSETQKQIDKISESLKQMTEVGDQLEKTLRNIEVRNPPDKAFQVFEATLKANAGLAAQLRDRMNEMLSIQTTAKANALAAALERQAAARALAIRDGGRGFNQKEYERETEAVNKLRASIQNLDVTDVVSNLTTSIKTLTDAGAEATLIANVQKQIIDIKTLAAEGKATEEAIQGILNAPSQQETTAQLLESTKAGLVSFQTELGKFNEKVATPFDKMAEGLGETLKAITQTDKDGNLTKAAKALADTIDVKGSPLEKAMSKFRKEGESATQTLTRMQGELDKNIKIMQEAPGKIQEQQAELKSLSNLRKMDGDIAQRALDLEDKILNTKISALQAQLDNLTVLEATKENNATILDITSKIQGLEAERKSDAQERFEIVSAEAAFAQQQLNMQGRMQGALKSQLESREKLLRQAKMLRNFEDPTRRTTKLTPKEERELQKTLAKERERIILKEGEITRAKINIEFRLIDEKYRLMAAEAKGNEALIKSITTARLLAMKTRREAEQASFKSDMAALGTLSGGDFDVISDEAVNKAARAAFESGDTMGERFFSGFLGANAAFDELNLKEKFEAMRAAMQPMIDAFESLGPEGQLVASMQAGVLNIGVSFANFAQNMEKNQINFGDIFSQFAEGGMDLEQMFSIQGFAETSISALSAVGSAVSGLASVMAAASQQRIAGIDAEIAAEKKRDGKSAQSIQRIRGLEKKKEAEKRKAFEMNKKMMIAQAVIATASGMIGAYAGLLGTPMAPIAAAVAAMIGVFGAAQIAIISGMTYQGGAGGGVGAGPSGLAIGKRAQSSDLSKSQSARGELAYFRGARGTGGAENFTPAFYGKRNRAVGGPTGFVVGEQGPELFMPDRPGTIVPADDTAAMAQGVGNVNISINAIDASGVEEVLTQQQGNIIAMIRQAANQTGEDFLEDVDETTYTTPAVGRA